MKRAALIIGLLFLAIIWGGPLFAADENSFTAHMLAHMGVVAVAAPLIALGIAGTEWDFSRRLRLFSPVPASLLELVVVWMWHAPALRALAETSPAAATAEQASFLAAGLILWLSCTGHSGHDRNERSAAGAFGLLFTSVHMTLLGALLALTPRPLYRAGEVTCLGVTLSAGQDQQLGGVIMLMVGAAVYLIGGLALLARLLAAHDARGRTDRRLAR
ncbi:cytochrome c oxidase assembly protein [Mesorhizobium sp. WSM2239]|uniref:Cytochrome c oxidase assembly protein n=2 Tax=unclassified Mesorhizobium TaxID=325217 RepID=A0AAU8D6U9_9HYPH